jgi:hypothetical protein
VGAKPPAEHLVGARLRLVATFETDAHWWERSSGTDVHDPGAWPYGITTRWTLEHVPGRHPRGRNREVRDAPEAKALGPGGEPCGRLTKGPFRRRPIVAGPNALNGKEANPLEERASGDLTVDRPMNGSL